MARIAVCLLPALGWAGRAFQRRTPDGRAPREHYSTLHADILVAFILRKRESGIAGFTAAKTSRQLCEPTLLWSLTLAMHAGATAAAGGRPRPLVLRSAVCAWSSLEAELPHPPPRRRAARSATRCCAPSCAGKCRPGTDYWHLRITPSMVSVLMYTLPSK